MNKKAIFFDIDGTLWDAKNFIPESTKEALIKLHENGHKTFICSGRARAYIQNPELMALNFDGVLAGCGTHVEYHGEDIYYHTIDSSLAYLTLKTVRKYGIVPILEGKDYLYFDIEDFGEDAYGKKLVRELGERRLPIGDIEKSSWTFSKLSCGTANTDTETCFKELSPYYDFLVHNSSVVEMVPKGHSKASGIEKICSHLGVDIADTFAVGDSVNDIEMLKFAGNGIAMGNGTKEAKDAADYITTDFYDNGIYNAMKHFGLI